MMALASLAHSIAIAFLPLVADGRHQKWPLQAEWSGEEYKAIIRIFPKLSCSTETIDQTINQTATANQKLQTNDVKQDSKKRK